MATTIDVSIIINASTADVWREVERLEDHVEWMADAESIVFLTEQTRGVGTRMEVATRIGPLSTKDVMEFTSWDDGKTMAIRHTGMVEGVGAFTLESVDDTTTLFRWKETLSLPWYFAGPLGEVVAKPILAAVWRRNLKRLKHRIEG